MAHLETRRKIHPPRLLADRRRDRLAAVPGIDAPQPGRAVEDLATVRRRVVHVLGTGEQTWCPLELPVRRERHPQRLEIVGVGTQRLGHGTSCSLDRRTVVACGERST